MLWEAAQPARRLGKREGQALKLFSLIGRSELKTDEMQLGAHTDQSGPGKARFDYPQSHGKVLGEF